MRFKTSLAFPGCRISSRIAAWSNAPRNREGTSGKKIGNAHLRWAFAEAAVLFLRQNQPGKKYFTKLEHKHGKAKALTVLAHKLARAVYYMLSRQQGFDLNRFVAA